MNDISKKMYDYIISQSPSNWNDYTKELLRNILIESENIEGIRKKFEWVAWIIPGFTAKELFVAVAD